MAQKHKRAFTLVEVLIVILIIGILAGLIMLSSGSATDTAERTRCVADRRSLRSALYIFRVEKGGTTSADLSATLKEVLDKMFDNGQGTVSGDSEIDGICPTKGIYAVTVSDDKYLIACSVHGGDGGSGGTGTGGGGGGGGGTGDDSGGGSGTGGESGGDVMIPGTTVVISVNKQWDSIQQFLDSLGQPPYSLTQGDAIKVGDDYYVAMNYPGVSWESKNEKNFFGEDRYFNITNDKVSEWKNNGGDFKKGDICSYNGNYYVSKSDNYKGNPETATWDWVRIINTN